MKTFKTFFFLLLLAALSQGCIQDDIVELEDNIITAKSITNVNAVIIGSRNKIKQKPRRNWRGRVVVEDPSNTVATVAVELLPTGEVQPTPANYEMELAAESENGRKRFTFGQLDFENGDATGLPFKQLATMLDENGEQIGELSETWVTAQDNDGTDVDRIEAVYQSPTSVAIPLRLSSENSNNLGEVFARVELYGRILIKGEPIEFEMTVPNNGGGNTVTGMAIAQLSELLGGGDIQPGDELMISITSKDINGELIDEDYFIMPVTIGNASQHVRSSKTFVFEETFYVETRVDAQAGVSNILMTIPPLEGQEFEPYMLNLEPVAQNNGVITYSATCICNPTFVGSNDSQTSVLHTMALVDDAGNTIEETAILGPLVVLEGITRNPKHIIRPNGSTHIRTRLKNPIAEEVGYATMSIPQDIAIGNQDEIILGASQMDDGIYRIDGDFVYTYVTPNPGGTNYTTTVTTYTTAGELIGSEQVTFEIDDRRSILNLEATPIRLEISSDGAVAYGTIVGTDGNQVEGVRLIFEEPFEGPAPLETEINIPYQYSENNSSFSSDIILFEDTGELLGSTYNMIIDYVGAQGDILLQFHQEAVIQSPEERVELENVSLFQNADGETFTFSLEAQGDRAQDIAQVAIFLTPLDGGSDADPEDFLLEFDQETPDGRTYLNNYVTFADPESVIGMLYLAEITITYNDGGIEDFDWDALEVDGYSASE